jgi:hypothetical protein
VPTVTHRRVRLFPPAPSRDTRRMATHPRYRVEDGAHCVDVRLTAVEQLFDNRDPAPFRERDLDPDLLEYLTAAGDDLVSHGPFRVVFWFPAAVDDDRIVPAFRAHLAYERERVVRRRRRERRTGLAQLAIGAVLLVALVSLASVVRALPTIGPIASEGLTISAWVIMWRPLQVLLYDWLPAARERRVLDRLHAAPVAIRVG